MLLPLSSQCLINRHSPVLPSPNLPSAPVSRPHLPCVSIASLTCLNGLPHLVCYLLCSLALVANHPGQVEVMSRAGVEVLMLRAGVGIQRLHLYGRVVLVL